MRDNPDISPHQNIVFPPVQSKIANGGHVVLLCLSLPSQSQHQQHRLTYFLSRLRVRVRNSCQFITLLLYLLKDFAFDTPKHITFAIYRQIFWDMYLQYLFLHPKDTTFPHAHLIYIEEKFKKFSTKKPCQQIWATARRISDKGQVKVFDYMYYVPPF